MPNTRFTSRVQIGTTTALILANLGLFLYVQGNAKITGNLTVGGSLTSSGQTISIDGASGSLLVADRAALSVIDLPMTSTGGNVKVSGGAKYDTFLTRLPQTSTGVITAVSLEFAGTPLTSFGLDCGFVDGAESGTGTVIVDNALASTGQTLYVAQTQFSGSLVPTGLWDGDTYFKCGTLTDPGSDLDARVKIYYYDTSAD